MFLNSICDIDAPWIGVDNPTMGLALKLQSLSRKKGIALMRRVVVFGTTGSGKSRLAERLAARRGLRVVELDALFWGRDWQPAPVELFRHRVERETGGS